LGIRDAEHEETAPDAQTLIISKLSCSIAGQTRSLYVLAGTKAAAAYGVPVSQEQFLCNYGLNPNFRQLIEKTFCVSGMDEDGEIRMLELPTHKFYVATLFVPQMLSKPGSPHPLITSFLTAAM